MNEMRKWKENKIKLEWKIEEEGEVVKKEKEKRGKKKERQKKS